MKIGCRKISYTTSLIGINVRLMSSTQEVIAICTTVDPRLSEQLWTSLCPSPLAHSTGCIASPAREKGVWWSGCSGHGTEECLEFYLNSIIMRMRVHFAAGKKLLHAAAMRQLSCRVCGKELTDHRERRVLHSSANKEVLPVLEKYISQGRINPAMISPIASGGPWICKHPCYKELKRVQEIQNELQTSGHFSIIIKFHLPHPFSRES